MRELEDKILRLIEKADELFDSNSKLGYRFIKMAHKLYEREFGGYKKEIDRSFSEVFNKYLEEYIEENRLPLILSNFQ